MKRHMLQELENYVRESMDREVGHDFKHVDRVRNWALFIAREEGYSPLYLVAATALLHDIGLPRVKQRSEHGPVGAMIAKQYLQQKDWLAQAEIELIAYAIHHHNTKQGSSPLLNILRDADMLDLFGAVGIMRAFTSKSALPEYEPENIKGTTFGYSTQDFDLRFQEGIGVGPYIIDQINFQVSCYDNLTTQTAKNIASPLLDYMQAYVQQLASEITTGVLFREGAPQPDQTDA